MSNSNLFNDSNFQQTPLNDAYQFNTFSLGACIFFPGFNFDTDEKCTDDYFKKLKEILFKNKNSIVIVGGRFPLYLSRNYFDNQEGGKEAGEFGKYISVDKYETIQISFQNEISELSKNNKIILIYPIPEVGWHVPSKVNNILKNTKNNIININEYITTSYQVYQNRTESSFKLLNSIKGDNIYRVYPHTLFCNTKIKNRCVTHDDKNIFYADTDHPSLKGAEMINELIMKEIEKIELKSN